jgi:hypothetical protein
MPIWVLPGKAYAAKSGAPRPVVPLVAIEPNKTLARNASSTSRRLPAVAHRGVYCAQHVESIVSVPSIATECRTRAHAVARSARATQQPYTFHGPNFFAR